MNKEAETSRETGVFLEIVRIVAPLLLLSIGVVGLIVLWNRRPISVKPETKKDAPLVDTRPVVSHAGDLTIATNGQVVPYREVSLSAEVAGRITEKTDVCRAGKFVRRGQLLLKIDPRDYVLAKKRLTEEFDQAEIAIKELDVEIGNTQSLIELARDDLKLQQDSVDRQTKLVAARATSTAAVDQAKLSLLQARSSLTMFENQLALSRAKKPRLTSATKLIGVRLEQAELDLERTEVKSPIDGMVVVESVEVDSYAQKGTALVTIEDTSAVEVRCHLRMDELQWIWSQADKATGPDAALPETAGSPRLEYQLPETPVTIVYRLADQEFIWQGRLWRYDGIGLDGRTRTVPCRVLVEAPRDVQTRTGDGPTAGPPALVRGMFVSLEIHTQPTIDLIEVPEVAVQPGNRVWRVRDKRLNTVGVHVVEIADGVAVLRSQPDRLAVGDRVVISPLADVTEFMAIRERKQPGKQPDNADGVAMVTEEKPR